MGTSRAVVESEVRSQTLRLLTGLAVEMQKRLDLEELLQLMVDRTSALLGTAQATVRLLDPSGKRLLAVCRSGPASEEPAGDFALGEGLLGWIVEHGEAIRSGEPGADPRRAAGDPPSGSFLGVPLVARNRCLGVISAVTARRDDFSIEHEEMVTLLAGICAPYVEIARLSRVAEELKDFVVRDRLTGLFNHAHFQDGVEAEIGRSSRHGEPFSVVLVDLDHFGAVNEARGHVGGEALLRVVAQILSGKGSRTDLCFHLRAEDMAARYGGDEFALLLPSTPKAGAASKGELLREYIEGYDFGALELPPQTVSLGVSCYPEDADDRCGLLGAAEKALRMAKRGGRNTVVAYSAAVSSDAERALSEVVELERFVALQDVIDQRAFDFAYQPIVDGRSHDIVAYEALCRPTHEAFPGPAELFAIAERAGRIVELGRACREVVMRALASLPAGRLLFVNLHPHELNDPRLVRGESELLANAERVVFEITETSAVRDYDRLRRVIARLREMGFRIALDDLGAGYAGLNSLALLEPDYVKIDMALIRAMRTRSATARLVKHILEFCAEEGVTAIAEGVEGLEEWEAVRAAGCPLMQGYHLARPGPPFPPVSAPPPPSD